MPEMVLVDSSSIEAIGHDDNRAELYVRFLESGETYVYQGVERSVYEELLHSESKGGYFNTHIRPRYGCYKLGTRPRQRSG